MAPIMYVSTSRSPYWAPHTYVPPSASTISSTDTAESRLLEVSAP